MPAKILKGLKPTLPVSVVKPAAPAPGPSGSSIPKIEVIQPHATINKNYPDGTSTQTNEDVGGPIQVTGPQANVGVKMGMTIQTEPYNNFRFDVSLFLPCAVEVDEINDTYIQVKEWVEGRVEEISDEVAGQMAGNEAQS